mgnify:CR=1 FL=1
MGEPLAIDVVPILPGMLKGFLEESILKRAVERKLIDIRIVDLRTYGEGRHRVVDDAPYGGGGGMVKTAPSAGRPLTTSPSLAS